MDIAEDLKANFNDDQFINDKSPFYQIKQNLDKLQEIFQDELFQIINCFPDFNQRFSYFRMIRK